MIETWKLSKIYRTRAMFFCHKHKSKRGAADLDLTIEGPFSGKAYCYGCGYSTTVPMADVIKLRNMRGEIKEQQVVKDWGKLHQQYVRKRYQSGVFPPLKVSVPVLTQCGWGWDGTVGAHTFPERNEKNQIIGILRRFTDGNKGVVAGSKRGLSIPTIQFDSSKKLYITEGISDLCVILECGLQGIARPNANSGDDLVVHWLCLHSREPREIVIIPDNDEAGYKGADNLHRQLNDVKVEGSTKNRFHVIQRRPEANDLMDFYLQEGKERTKVWLK